MLIEQYLNILISIISLILLIPFSLIILLINLLFIFVLIHGHRYFCTKFVYICSRHLLIADLISALTQLFVIIPIIILPYKIAKDFLLSRFVETFLTLETLSHMAIFNFIFLQSIGHIHNQLLFSQNEMVIHSLNNWGNIICICLWIWLTCLLLLFGIYFRCILNFNVINYSFYYVCYNENNNGIKWDYLMKIYLGILMLISVGINLFGAVFFERKIQKLFPGNSRENAISTTTANIRRTSISVSVIQKVQLQQSNQRKILYEMFKSKAFFVQGFYMSLSLIARYFGFYLIPLFNLYFFGNGIQLVNERVLFNIFGNLLILVRIY
ncbi:hypothetical protein Mgra_00003722 [Meloidogyne graminicola]|uniref:Uncharacterized protein n=1 Tax=Meloidogyne graminicola TaxID=189291 RepID=A0A8S9ZU24_9BILA|nr:hypothetical protein Mgra_00003722 [Meloidogyne graminicola]